MRDGPMEEAEHPLPPLAPLCDQCAGLRRDVAGIVPLHLTRRWCACPRPQEARAPLVAPDAVAALDAVPVVGEIVRALVGARSSTRHPLLALLAVWEEFVIECEDGYRWSRGEYLDEGSVRDDLEQVLTAPPLAELAIMKPVSSAVAALDARLRACFHPTRTRAGSTWWRRGVVLADETHE